MWQRLADSLPVRGFPLLQSFLVVLAVVLAGVPVYRLTRPAVTVAATPAIEAIPGATTPAAPLDVEAVFAPAPTDFQIKNLDQTVLAGHGPEVRFTTRWAGSVPPDGVDLVVQAHWPSLTGADTGAGPSAAKLTVRFPDGRTVEKSFWADANGTLTDVLTLPGATPTTTTGAP